jgi:hypothetical protein
MTSGIMAPPLQLMSVFIGVLISLAPGWVSRHRLVLIDFAPQLGGHAIPAQEAVA